MFQMNYDWDLWNEGMTIVPSSYEGLMVWVLGTLLVMYLGPTVAAVLTVLSRQRREERSRYVAGPLIRPTVTVLGEPDFTTPDPRVTEEEKRKRAA